MIKNILKFNFRGLIWTRISLMEDSILVHCDKKVRYTKHKKKEKAFVVSKIWLICLTFYSKEYWTKNLINFRRYKTILHTWKYWLWDKCFLKKRLSHCHDDGIHKPVSQTKLIILSLSCPYIHTISYCFQHARPHLKGFVLSLPI